MAKADWECWKKVEEQFEQMHGPSFFYLDDDDQQACRDVCTRERCNADVSEMAKEMDMLPYSPSLFPSLLESHTKNSGQKKRRRKKRRNTGGTRQPQGGKGLKIDQEGCQGCVVEAGQYHQKPSYGLG